MLRLPSLGEMDQDLAVRIYLCTGSVDMRKGFAIWYKRLEEGTFRLPAAKSEAVSVELKASELAMLLAGIDLTSIKRRQRFTRPA